MTGQKGRTMRPIAMRVPLDARNFSLNAKFTSAFLLSILLIAAIGTIGLWGIVHIQTNTDQIVNREMRKIEYINTMSQNFLAFGRDVRGVALSGDPTKLPAFAVAAQGYETNMEEAWKAYQAMPHSAREITEIQQLAAYFPTYFSAIDTTIALSRLGSPAGITQIRSITSAPAKANVPNLLATLNDLQGFARSQVGQLQQSVHDSFLLISWIVSIATLLAISIIVIIRGFMVHLVVNPVEADMQLHQQIDTLNSSLQLANERLTLLATTDPLTEILNHRMVLETLNVTIADYAEHGRPCSLLFFDLDHFKAINDGFGHATGDKVLQQLAQIATQTLGKRGTLGRWGGEEFIAILPEMHEHAALELAEELRAAVASHAFQVGGGLHVTCSVGVATMPTHGATSTQLLEAADRAMFFAKKLGRNQVRRAGEVVEAAREDGGPGDATSRDSDMLQGVVTAIATLVESRDGYTGEHLLRVSQLTFQVATALGLASEEARMIEIAARLHDIGKVAIPDAILNKRQKLTPDEQVIMRSHTVVGGTILSHIPSLRGIVPIVRGHHERWNGSGYPDGIKGENIPLGARIITVVDAYDAMTSDRPYRAAHTTQWALDELHRNAGSQFDPDIVQALQQLLSPLTLEAAKLAA